MFGATSASRLRSSPSFLRAVRIGAFSLCTLFYVDDDDFRVLHTSDPEAIDNGRGSTGGSMERENRGRLNLGTCYGQNYVVQTQFGDSSSIGLEHILGEELRPALFCPTESNQGKRLICQGIFN